MSVHTGRYRPEIIQPAASIENGDEIMMSPTLTAFAQVRLRSAIGAVVLTLLGLLSLPSKGHAQGLVQGVQQGAAAGNKAAGPVGGVLGGALGGVVGVFTGVLGVGNNQTNQPAPAANGAKQAAPAKGTKVAKGSAKGSAKGDMKGGEVRVDAKGDAAKGTEVAAKPAQQVLTQPQGEPQITAEQIVANSDANIQRIKDELKLTPDQEKNWTAFNSAMHYLGHNGADRLNLRIARAKRDPPDDIIEQMRNEAQFLDDRALDQRNVADAAEPLYASLDDKQKQTFIDEMVRLSHERGLD
jgi:hypothetical protein